MIDRELLKDPNIKIIIRKLAIYTLLQAFFIVLQSIFLTKALVISWEMKSLKESIVYFGCFMLSFCLRQLLINHKSKMLNRFSLDYTNELQKILFRAEYNGGLSLISQNNGTAAVAKLGISGIQQIQAYLQMVLDKMVNLTIIPVILLGVVFSQSWLSGLVLLLTIPLIIFFMIILGMMAKKQADSEFDTFEKLSSSFIDAINGLKTLKMFGLSKDYDHNVYEVSENYRKVTMKTLRIAFLSSFAMSFLTTIAIAIVAVFLGVGLINNHIALFPALLSLILAPDYFLSLKEFGSDYHATLDGQMALTKMQKIINDKEINTSDSKIDENLAEVSDDTTFKVAGLTYKINDQVILNNINFSVTGHARVGIIGESGGGKTTLLNNIGGFIRPATADSFTINGEKYDDLNKFSWHENLLYLPQHPDRKSVV